ncbi:hypothetical protein [Mesorhizobium metallidurans]|uniref:hypothetical protein n=1 Tax=Mesorhizobium metallidurans TaxID=489722 RepID=UPI00058BF4C8|nr:hypothetical protein [Mesorhizobium metallidurans]
MFPAFLKSPINSFFGIDRDGGSTFEFCGPRVLSCNELIREIARSLGMPPMLVPMPFAVWMPSQLWLNSSPTPPIRRNQVELMHVDNVAAVNLPGLKQAGIEPRDIQQVIDIIIWVLLVRRRLEPMVLSSEPQAG